MITALTETTAHRHEEESSVLFFMLAGPASLFLFLTCARVSLLRGVYRNFLLFQVVFLGTAIATSLLHNDFTETHFVVTVVYLFQFVLVSGVYFWACALSDDEFERSLRWGKSVFLVGVASIILSPLMPYYANAERAGGFYIDQNHAATVSLLALVLIANYPARSRGVTALQAQACVIALLMTLSRTGMSTLVLLFALFIAAAGSFRLKVAMTASAVALVIVGWILIDHQVIDLTYEQKQRLVDVAHLAEGETRQKTYDQRDILFDIGLSRIKDHFPFGQGIGEYNSLEYGVRNRYTGMWLGVHNTYYLVLGEGGLWSILLFLAFWFDLLGRSVVQSSYRYFTAGSTIIVMIVMMTTHSVLNDKVVAITIAFLLAAAARVSRVRGPGLERHPRSVLAAGES
ncbi:MAG: O-antigen ligase family protein [Hyphomicrobiaceae bacterium]